MGGCSSKSGAATASNPQETKPEPAGPRTYKGTYRQGEELGRGAFSVVYRCQDRKSKENFAVKVVDRTGLSKQDDEALKSEVSILKKMNCEYVVKCYDFFDEDPKSYFVVIEYLQGGELFDRIVKKTSYNEKEARDLIFILLSAIKYCHDNFIVHRDLKPENLLLKSETDDNEIKLADFGFAAETDATDKTLTTQCGTPGYVAPEILLGVPYGRPADMWSVGVITYIILGGYPPFYDDNQKMLFKKIRAGAYEFHHEYWRDVSVEAKDLIKNLLVVKPGNRFTVDQALNHPWLKRDAHELAGRNLSSNLTELRKFNAKRRFRAAIKAVVAVNRIKTMSSLMTPAPASDISEVQTNPLKHK